MSVDFSVEEGIDTTVYRISKTHFSQVLDNLVNNAVRAVPPGGEVSARLFQSGTQLRMKVEDSGSGMPDTFIPIAFDRFSRPDEQRGSAEGGNGLGLSIVAAIVANAGGTITLANRTEGGLTAEVILPNAT